MGHIGNTSLFLSGIFPERIRHRAQSRGFPDPHYYEALGRTQYRVAGDHRLAPRFRLDHIFQFLSAHFEQIRLALNDLSDRLLTLERTPVPDVWQQSGSKGGRPLN